MSIIALLPVVLKSCLERLSAQIAELVDFHFGISLEINLLDKSELSILKLWDVVLKARVDQA